MIGVKSLSLKRLLVFLTCVLLSAGLPLNEDITRHEEVTLESRAHEPSHLLKKEHREYRDERIREAVGQLRETVDKVFSSKTASAVDRVASSIVNLAGGVAEDLGNFFVAKIDQLPKVIERLSETVGEAVDSNREKILIMVKGIKNQDETDYAENTRLKVAEALENSQFQSSLQSLEENFASLMGKFIGVTYKNADDISSALSKGLKRIVGTNQEENMKVLSRSYKESDSPDAAEDKITEVSADKKETENEITVEEQ